ncbi:M28 family peptidase [Pricia sp.]|uniref:M28 family peptidase n=1 Tax=Pricia sp. TaxID=2268138 RepID=UPI003593272F
MKPILFLALGLAMACNSSQPAVSESTKTPTPSEATDPTTYAETITEAELKAHLYTYASDEFEGRETGKPGQKKAVEYLKTEYVRLDIPAAKKNGDYFQKVPLEVAQLPTGTVTVNGKEYVLGNGLLTFSQAEGTYDNIVYVGYGIEEGDYSDYRGLDVEGKVILIKAGEPKNQDGSYTLSGSDEKSIWSNLSESIGKRMELASSKGASAVFYYDEENYGRFKSRFDYMKNNDSGQMELADDEEAGFANFFIDAQLAKALLPDIETSDTPELLPVDMNIAIKSENKEVDSENVVAIIKGSEKPDEYLVISSHLDHIGITADGQINNGADDDGSGSVALLEIAEAFKKAADAGQGPKRSVVFLHVTGEEKGLLGSRYYTDFDPIFPLENTVVNLNIDMIGRIDPKRNGNRNYLYLIGSDKLSTDLHELSESVNKKYTNIEFDYTFNDENDPNRFYYRSDHYNFAKNNIPIIFYFNGTHADYHKPSDTVEKINYDLLENRTRLIFYTAWEVANRDQRIIVDKASK